MFLKYAIDVYANESSSESIEINFDNIEPDNKEVMYKLFGIFINSFYLHVIKGSANNLIRQISKKEFLDIFDFYFIKICDDGTEEIIWSTSDEEFKPLILDLVTLITSNGAILTIGSIMNRVYKNFGDKFLVRFDKVPNTLPPELICFKPFLMDVKYVENPLACNKTFLFYCHYPSSKISRRFMILDYDYNDIINFIRVHIDKYSKQSRLKNLTGKGGFTAAPLPDCSLPKYSGGFTTPYSDTDSLSGKPTIDFEELRKSISSVKPSIDKLKNSIEQVADEIRRQVAKDIINNPFVVTAKPYTPYEELSAEELTRLMHAADIIKKPANAVAVEVDWGDKDDE